MRRMGRIWTWREENAGAFWDEARTVLKRHGIIAVPTETFYALAVNPFSGGGPGPPLRPQRPGPGKTGAGAGGRTGDAYPDGPGGPGGGPAADGSLLARSLDHNFAGLPHLPRLLTGGTGTIGVRQPRQSLICRLISGWGIPSPAPAPIVPGTALATGRTKWPGNSAIDLDLILDAGPCPGGLPSTIVDVTRSSPRLVRAGAIPPPNWRRLSE